MRATSELFQVMTPADALAALRRHWDITPRVERVPTAEALDRVLAEGLLAPHQLPGFPRSTMDGYAVRAADTYGSSAGIPALLAVAGEVAMGRQSTVELGPGQAAVLHTGGMLPVGADAVVMIEHTQKIGENNLEVYRAVAPGENVVQPGEDVRRGDLLLTAGHRLRPQDLGGLLALGITVVPVAARARVAILSQGDELVPPDYQPGPGQVRDINGHTLAALTRKAGGEALLGPRILPDRQEDLERAARAALERADLVVFSAGSSVGARDLTAKVIAAMGGPGVLAHGLSIRPGKPTVVALCANKPVFGLPGNPVSAMIVFGLVVAPAIALALGAPPLEPARVTARLARNVASHAGREDFLPVRLVRRAEALWAEPVFGKSNLIYTLVRADGLITVPLDRTGLEEGEDIEVRLF